ncbi:MAG TPA: lysine 2,3-aminomutase [Myxococcales bacterium]|jgi:lysine 2,3-aminomutase|nr:lysine 2,3-aminomutase [Myxococcales bacterium]
MAISQDILKSAPGAQGVPEANRIIEGAPAIASPIRTRFPASLRSIWKETPDSDWNDWRWQLRNRVTDLATLEKVVELTPEARGEFERTTAEFNMAITPYYASLMDPKDPHCPVRMQSVPVAAELNVLPTDLEDPLAEDRDMPVPGLTHRYPDRVLFYVSHNCPMFCRHCTRKRKVANPSSAAASKQIDDGIAYIASNPKVRDVVVSGGDPLTLSDERVDDILGRLRAIPHVEIIRLGTRCPVTLPQRITEDLVKVIRKHHPLFVNTHFNHPKECTAESFEAARKLSDAGCSVGNQMVLLKGVNDDPKIVKALNQKLLMMRIRPYYIYQCDLSKGIGHFRTEVAKGIEIIENLRGWTSGMAVPHFVVDGPDGGGKIPLMPNYVVSHEGKHLVLRNYAKKQCTYEEP